MNDLYQYFSQDIAVSSTGDFQTVDGVTRGQQRVLRRLLTNPGDYIFHPEYGAGLPKMVGETLDIQKIKALIRGQILLEPSVAKTPEPEIEVTPISGGLSCAIRYADAISQESVVLSFNVNQ